MKVNRDGYVCLDCCYMMANGELPGEVRGENESRADKVARATAGWTLAGDDEHPDLEFSWSACETCGSALGGERFFACELVEGEDEIMETASFDRFELNLTREDALAGSHIGSCDDDVAALTCKDYIRDQLDAIEQEKIIAELKETGAWSEDDGDFEDETDNRERIVWIACCNIREELNSPDYGK